MNFLFMRGSDTEMLQNLLQNSRIFPSMTILFLSITFLCTYLGIQKIFFYFCQSATLLIE